MPAKFGRMAPSHGVMWVNPSASDGFRCFLFPPELASDTFLLAPIW